MKYRLTCSDFERAGYTFNCCCSCHEDVEFGYDLLEQYPDYEIEGRRKKSKFWAEVCCQAPELKTAKAWAKVAIAYRKNRRSK